tara:strand:+ start:1266 stop:1916 length:651 start_codon:yes stop_codon:yes gene_type:complete
MSKIQTNKIQHTANGAAEFTLPTADGTNGQVLKTNGSGTLSFGADQGGKILQVVSVSDSVRESTGTISMSSANTYYDTPFAVTITPSATSSKILLMGHVMGEGNFDDYFLIWRINRAISGGSTTAIQAASAGNRPLGISVAPSGFYSSNADSTPTVINFAGLLDSPSTTSAITYTFQINCTQASSKTFFYNQTVNTGNAIDNERGLSWITAQEISG